MYTRLTAVLRQEESQICAIWRKQLRDTALFTSGIMLPNSDPIRGLFRDVIRILEDETPLTQAPPPRESQPNWRINLTQAIEVLLGGEVAMQEWITAHLDASAAERLEVFQTLNRAFHQLIRFHARRYCEQCRSEMPAYE